VITHIDVCSLLRRTECGLYSNLVTRPTGAAVRSEIEQLLRDGHAGGQRTLTVIDFSNVGLLDFSCADEIVAKLLLRESADGVPEGYFVFRGILEHHLDAIEHVLERHRLAMVAEEPGSEPRLVGIVDERESALWATLRRRGPATAPELAEATGLAAAEAQAILDGLCRRKLAMRVDDAYLAVGGLPLH
jgi:hypothetical protein